ncbi:MAG: tyrosine-type recombinase/integrase [Thermofilaceae archaeon]
MTQSNLERFKIYMDAEGLSEKTKRDYLGVVRIFLSELGDREPNLDDVVRFLSKYKDSPITQQTYAYALRHYFKCVGGIDPRKIPVGRKESPEVRALTEDDVKKIVETIDLLGFPPQRALKYKAMIALAYELGLRIGELAKLKRRDLNVEKWECYVKREKGSVSGIVPITTDWVKDVVSLYLTRKPKEEELLFPNEKGEVYSVPALSSRIRSIMKKAGYPLKPHILRHTRATELLRRRVDFFTVSRILGHKNPIHTTTYLHLVVEDLRKMLEETKK